MKRQIAKIIIVSILIMTLSMMDFVIVGQNISMAMAESNVRNVEFDAYLKQETEPKISSEQVLMIEVNVKEKGVLKDAKIGIENSNFTIQKDKVQNSYIKDIHTETNEIELNAIVYQNHITFEIPIQFNRKTEFETDYFQKEITIRLEGTYKDENEKKVEAQKVLTINWTNDADIILDQNIKKYKQLGDGSVLLEQQITTEVTNNALPRENETLRVQIPVLEGQQPKEIYVISNGVRLAEENVKKQGDTTLEIINTNTLPWKEKTNYYQVIYQYDKEVKAAQRVIELNTTTYTKLFTKQMIEKQGSKSLEIQTMGNLVSIQKNTSNEIYKGYLYAGAEQETIFTEDNKIEISNREIASEIEISEAGEEFVSENTTLNMADYTIYKNTRVNQEDFIRILGADGKITILNGDGTVLGQINQENLSINYEIEARNIRLVMSKPITEGEITISHTKALKGQQPYSKEQLKSCGKMITKTKVKTEQEEEIAQAKLTLKDTKTEAKLEISNTNLSTLQMNNNVEFLVTLRSDSIEYDLYKNPVIRIVLPSELSIEVKNVSQLNALDELSIINPIIFENEIGEKIIELSLQGEQTYFENAINGGIQILITGDIVTSKTIPTKSSEIQMICTNENRIGEEFRTTVPINLNSKYGVLMINELSNYNEKGEHIESIDDKLKTGSLNVKGDSQVATQDIHVINNYENAITDVSIIGKMPTIGEEIVDGETLKATFETTLLDAIHAEEKEVKIEYAEKNSEWKEEIEDITKVKAFKIQLQDNKLEPQQSFSFSYPWNIPEGIEEGESTYSTVSLEYNYLENTVRTNSAITLSTGETEKQESVPFVISDKEQLRVELIQRTEGKLVTEGQEVFEGQGIQYTIKLTNQSQEDMNHLHVKATNTNAIYFNEVKHDFEYGDVKDIITKIEEDETLKQKEFNIETLEAGKTIELEYQIAAKEVEGNDKAITGEIAITADNLEEKTYPTQEVKIKQAELKLTFASDYAEEIQIMTKEGLQAHVMAKNLTDKQLKDVIIEIPLSDEFEFYTSRFYVQPEDGYELLDYENNILRFKIPKIETGESIGAYFQIIAKSMPKDQMESLTRMFAYGHVNDKTYVSNELTKMVYQSETILSAEQTTNLQKDIIEDGEKLAFTFTIKNEGLKDAEVLIVDQVPNGLQVQESYLMKNGEKEPLQVFTNGISKNITIAAGETLIWVIEAEVNDDVVESGTLTNYATLKGRNIDIKTNEITYKIKGKEDLQDPSEKEIFSISGTVWNDENKNGIKEISEQKMSGMTMMLLNEENGNVLSEVTGTEGTYEFKNLEKGKYMVIAQYDATQYRLTEYQKNGVDQASNSDFVNKTITLQGNQMQVAATGSINLQQNVSNVDAGFIKGETFDFKLAKYINRIVIQDVKGTTVKQYNREQLAKVELDAKRVANSNILIEYEIDIINEGDIAGYVSEIVDYMPKDLQFSSEINKTWYQGIDGNLYTKELANQIIKPGETKKVILTLTKRMSQNNTGTIINTAEIAKSTNDFALKDKDSIEGNKVKGEDDMSTAEVIISIRTGSVIIYISLFIIIAAVLGIGSYVIKKQVLEGGFHESN